MIYYENKTKKGCGFAIDKKKNANLFILFAIFANSSFSHGSFCSVILSVVFVSANLSEVIFN